MPRKIKLEHLEQEFEKITKLGYTVVATEDQCLIWKGEDLIIDSDFHNNYYENATGAIGAFWDEEVKTTKTIIDEPANSTNLQDKPEG